MSEILIFILSTLGALFALLAGLGIVRMPDIYLRISVTTKAATLGMGLLLACVAIYFDEVSVTSRAVAIIFFILLTAPVGAHLIGRASYFTGNPLWDRSLVDDLKGQYDRQKHTCGSAEAGEVVLESEEPER